MGPEQEDGAAPGDVGDSVRDDLAKVDKEFDKELAQMQDERSRHKHFGDSREEYHRLASDFDEA